MSDANRHLLQSFNGNPPGQSTARAHVERQLGVHLPSDYWTFMLARNGGEGFIGPNAYVILWPVEQLFELNQAYQVSRCSPGLLLFGSDGGGEAFAFDTTPGKAFEVVAVPFVGMNLTDARVIAPDFDGFLERLIRS